MQRFLTTLSHKEPDQVPYFLLLTLHGAKELNMSIKDYYSDPDSVAEAQLMMQKKYHHDCLYSFYYASIETEAFGGDTRFYDDGPPNAIGSCLQVKDNFKSLKVPDIKNIPSLGKVIRTTEILKKNTGDKIPIIGVVMSPFSLPIMQIGFEKYLELIHFERELFWRLIEVNIEFCINWANAQISAGATAICYFDPMSSPTILPKEIYLETGYEISKKTISAIKGPTAVHLASGKSIPIIPEISETGTGVIGVSCDENLSFVKEACKNKITVLGNLNGLELCNWSVHETAQKVKKCIAEAGQNGGYILSDTHGEIPYQVPEENLLCIGETIREFGSYPLKF